MKDLIGQFGWVVLGVLIVGAIIFGVMSNQAERSGIAVEADLDGLNMNITTEAITIP